MNDSIDILDICLNRITGRILGGSTFFTHKECDPIHVEFGKEQVSDNVEHCLQYTEFVWM